MPQTIVCGTSGSWGGGFTIYLYLCKSIHGFRILEWSAGRRHPHGIYLPIGRDLVTRRPGEFPRMCQGMGDKAIRTNILICNWFMLEKTLATLDILPGSVRDPENLAVRPAQAQVGPSWRIITQRLSVQRVTMKGIKPLDFRVNVFVVLEHICAYIFQGQLPETPSCNVPSRTMPLSIG